MSKQSDAKRNQGYNDMPIPRTCGNCVYYESNMATIIGVPTEVNMHCAFGKFPVKKTATCLKWGAK